MRKNQTKILGDLIFEKWKNERAHETTNLDEFLKSLECGVHHEHAIQSFHVCPPNWISKKLTGGDQSWVGLDWWNLICRTEIVPKDLEQAHQLPSRVEN